MSLYGAYDATRRVVRDAFDWRRLAFPPPFPPWSLRALVGESDAATYERRGLEQLAAMVHRAGYVPGDFVLDIGCGSGRLARHLEPPYIGFDVSRRAISWCRQRLEPKLSFSHADIRNGLYNPHGAVEATEYAFPTADGQIDVAVAFSVFTHLGDAETTHYLGEAARSLKRGGVLLSSWYLVNDDAGARALLPGAFEHKVGYGESWVRSALKEAGFEVRHVYAPDGLCIQHQVVAVKV